MRVSQAMNIGGIKLNLLASSPSLTSVTVNLIKDSVTLFSKTLTLAEIKSMGLTTLNNWHGFIPFSSSASLYLSEGDYQIVLFATGYTYSETNFIGWCKDLVCTIGNVYGIIPTNYTLNPYSYRLIEYKPREN